MMQRVQLPVMFKDFAFSGKRPEVPVIRVKTLSAEEFRDGPVTPRLAVIDLDERTGRLRRPVRLLRPRVDGMPLRYEMPSQLGRPEVSEEQLRSARGRLTTLSAFATALETINLFETNLGFKVPWAFRSRQLLLVPRAGMLANAFYERETGSIQFYSFPDGKKHLVHTALSRDIVAHETAHALLDGLLPDLYDASNPQSLALHESIADLVTVLVSSQSEDELYFHVTESITEQTAANLASLAEEFGSAGARDSREKPLRDLMRPRTLASGKWSRSSEIKAVDRTQPHDVGTVLTSALFEAFRKQGAHYLRRYDSRWARRNEFEDPKTRAFREAGTLLTRWIFRPLFYLPPGEITLGDFCRALFCHPHARFNEYKGPAWGWLRRELVRRAAVDDDEPLQERWRVTPVLTTAAMDRLLSHPAATRPFVSEHRSLFGLPRGARFEVLPPRVLSHAQVAGNGDDIRPEFLILRVRWWETELHDIGGGLAREWRVPRGSSVTIDVDSRRCATILTSDRSASQRKDRGAYLRRLVNEGLISGGRHARSHAPEGLIPRSTRNGLWLSGSARALHLIDTSR